MEILTQSQIKNSTDSELWHVIEGMYRKLKEANDNPIPEELMNTARGTGFFTCRKPAQPEG